LAVEIDVAERFDHVVVVHDEVIIYVSLLGLVLVYEGVHLC